MMVASRIKTLTRDLLDEKLAPALDRLRLAIDSNFGVLARAADQNASQMWLVTALPPASETYLGRLAVLRAGGGAGVDQLYVCLGTAPGAFGWVLIV